MTELSLLTCHVTKAGQERAGGLGELLGEKPAEVCVPQINVQFFHAVCAASAGIVQVVFSLVRACFYCDFPFGCHSLGYCIPGLMQRTGHDGKN